MTLPQYSYLANMFAGIMTVDSPVVAVLFFLLAIASAKMA